MKTMESYLERKYREVSLLNSCLASPLDLRKPDSVGSVIEQKFRLAGALKAERALKAWAVTETARDSAHRAAAAAQRTRAPGARGLLQRNAGARRKLRPTIPCADVGRVAFSASREPKHFARRIARFERALRLFPACRHICRRCRLDHLRHDVLLEKLEPDSTGGELGVAVRAANCVGAQPRQTRLSRNRIWTARIRGRRRA